MSNELKDVDCPLCGKPAGQVKGNAKVYHLPCLMEDLKDVREAIKNGRGIYLAPVKDDKTVVLNEIKENDDAPR